jgi:hypothetical protein
VEEEEEKEEEEEEEEEEGARRVRSHGEGGRSRGIIQFSR